MKYLKKFGPLPGEKWAIFAFGFIPLMVCAAVNTFDPRPGSLVPVNPDSFLYCLGLVVAYASWSYSGSMAALQHTFRGALLFFCFWVAIYSIAGYSILTHCTVTLYPANPSFIASRAGLDVDIILTVLATLAFFGNVREKKSEPDRFILNK